ncbi:MAG: acyl--CoA ligase [Bacteroidales bacterium]|nr:acyl--CoA ligase [Bacteroidales bacterium]
MTIEGLIQNHSLSCPQKTALVSGNTEITYGDLWKEISGKASWFLSHAERGDRVILSASKSLEFVYTYFGAHLAGMICVPIDPETNQTRLSRIIDVSKPAFITGELRNHGQAEVLPFESIASDYPSAVLPLPKEEDVADLLFTTGTTGLPKGVTLTFKNQMAAAVNINTFIENTAEDIELLALPISHSFGLGRLRCVLAKGGTLVMLGSFASMKKFFGEMERCRVTGFGMVPASWSYILKMSGDKIGQFASRLRYIEIGSAFMSLENKQKLMQLLPNTRICMHYGLTEASRSAFISFHDDMEHLMSVGKPSPNTDIAIFSEDGRRVSPGEDGEICVKGDHVCSGYWGQPPRVFAGDFFGDYFRTGDWGHIDSDGFIYMVSRKKEIINVGGKKVSPIEVEEVLDTIDGIEESACIGIHDDVLGEKVKAFCVCSKDVDFEQVKKVMMKNLENYKVPECFEIVDSIPKTASGKIQRLLLKN